MWGACARVRVCVWVCMWPGACMCVRACACVQGDGAGAAAGARGSRTAAGVRPNTHTSDRASWTRQPRCRQAIANRCRGQRGGGRGEWGASMAQQPHPRHTRGRRCRVPAGRPHNPNCLPGPHQWHDRVVGRVRRKTAGAPTLRPPVSRLVMHTHTLPPPHTPHTTHHMPPTHPTCTHHPTPPTHTSQPHPTTHR